MSLLEVRINLVAMTGRYDLVVDEESFADRGANFFIRAGQRWLDRNSDLWKAKARQYLSLTQGRWYALLSDCRAIHEAWISNSAGEKWQLEKRGLGELRRSFSKSPALLDTSAPLWYALATIRTMPEIEGTTIIDQFGSTTILESADHHDFNSLVFLPPCDSNYTLEVHGNWYQPFLSSDSSKNFWTESEPFVLTLAACRAIEVGQRNRQGVLDWEAAIASEVQGLEFDMVDQESSEVHGMETKPL